MGKNVREMMNGYDCPVDALYLPARVHTVFGSSKRLNAICVFERDSGRPLSRHTGWMEDEMGVRSPSLSKLALLPAYIRWHLAKAVKGFELVIRSISTVGNYDYLFDYTFQLDGSIEIRLSASGYLQAGVWDSEQSEYGHPVRDTSMGSLHDHVINVGATMAPFS
jgi:primary-amine oxidase